MPFSQAPARARRILGGWRRSGWLWCCRRSCWWCSRRMNKRSSPAGSDRGGGGCEGRVQSRSTPSEAKPGSLWTCGPAPSSAATARVCHRPPDCTRGSPFFSAYSGILWCWLSSRLQRCEVAWCGPHFKPHQNHNRSLKLCLHHTGHVPVNCGRTHLHFEGAGNGSVVLTWIGRERELLRGASPISLVEHYVTFRHDSRLLSLLGFVHNWPTSRLSETKKKKEKENRFSLNGNGITTSFLGRQFYRSTLYSAGFIIHLFIYLFIYFAITSSGRLVVICIWKSMRTLSASFPGCACTISPYGQILVSWTILSGSFFTFLC